MAGLNCAMLARRSCSRRNRQTLGSRRSRDQRARAGRSQIGLLGLWTRKLIDAYHFALNVCRGCKALPPMHQIGPPIDWVSHRAATRRLAFGGRKRLTVSLPTARRTAPRVLSVGLPAQVVPSAVVLASNIREQGEILLQRLDHADFRMISIHSRARAAAARYIVRTLRELLDTSLRGDADRPLRRSNGSRVPTGDAQGVKRRGHRPRGRNLIDFGKKAGEVPEGQVELMWLELAERTCRRPCSEATSIR